MIHNILIAVIVLYCPPTSPLKGIALFLDNKTKKYLNRHFGDMIMMMESEIILRLVLAVIAGGIIGFERKKFHKPAGLRTIMLVCVGTALFVLITLKTFPYETARTIAGVATGIGFLGAGAIFRAKDHVKGLTTAASIWAVAAIGIVAGLGDYMLLAISTILVLLILELNRIEFFRGL
jgi:putative Mg2+ transporter-C (MgtC) family protein